MSTPTVAPAIALDRFLRHPNAHAHLVQARAALAAAGYGWLIDQGDAAVDDTHAQLRDFAQRHGGDFAPSALAEHPDWMLLPLFATLADWIAGRARTCIHNPTPSRPQPVHAAAWKPGLVTCRHCIRLFLLRKDSPKNRTCDGCGYIVAAGSGEGLWPSAVSFGLLTYQAAACDACRYWEAP